MHVVKSDRGASAHGDQRPMRERGGSNNMIHVLPSCVRAEHVPCYSNDVHVVHMKESVRTCAYIVLVLIKT